MGCVLVTCWLTPVYQAAYLEPRLLGVLAFFDAQLVNSNIAMADKKLVSTVSVM